jgi:putative transposase
MEATLTVYRDAVEFLATIIRVEWMFLAIIEGLDAREHAVEDLVISTSPRKKVERKKKDAEGNIIVLPPKDPAAPIEMTSGNKAKYPEFEALFGNMPAYLRRSAIRDAIGLVSSHNTRFDQWASKKIALLASRKTDKQKRTAIEKLGKPPTFQAKTLKTPAFYRGSTRKVQKAVGVGRTLKERIAGARTDCGGVLVWTASEYAALKLYNGKTWNWFCVKIKVTKLKPQQKPKFPESEGWVEGTPTLVPTGGTYEIHVTMEKKVLYKAKDLDRPVLSADLGINTRATATVVTSDGTILGRNFINCPQNTGQLEHLLGKIAHGYKMSGQPVEGRRSCRDLWKQVANLTDEIAHQVSANLVSMAKENGCGTIVFEYLGKMKVPRDFYGAKRLRKKLHYWLQGRIQRFTKLKAQTEGIRFSRVLARGTSAEAFDGSGPVKRTGTCKVARFQNGRIYDADLSASYNIAARYWIREIHEKYPKFLQEEAQVHDGTAVAVAVGVSAKAGRKAKATCGNTVVAGQGTTCPAVGSDVKRYVTGVPVARHQQVLASLISLAAMVGAQCTNTTPSRTHATARTSQGSAPAFA